MTVDLRLNDSINERVFDDYEADMKAAGDGYWRFWSARPTSKQREETGWPNDPS